MPKQNKKEETTKSAKSAKTAKEMVKEAPKEKAAVASKSDTGNKNKRRNLIIIGVIAAAVVVLGVVITIICINSAAQKREEEERLAQQKALDEKIAQCTKETKKDMLGFVSYCYEENGVDVPDEILQKDKDRADRIMAQAAYDVCMANAQLTYEELWDLNDNDPQNGDVSDSIRTYHVEFIQKEYDQAVDQCKTASALIGSYESGFKTTYRKKLVGWASPKSDKIAIIDRYNYDGKIVEASNMREDLPAPESAVSVGRKAAEKFKNEHLDLWY